MQFAQRIFSTRAGTIGVGAVAALAAALMIAAYLNGYRESMTSAAEPVSVMVAKSLIPKGLSGDVIASEELFQATSVRRSELKEGALTDPATLRGKVAAADVYPGEQLTVQGFSGAATLATRLTGDQRALTIPIDAAHGLIGSVQAGDHVDVLAGFNVKPVDALGRPLAAGGQERTVTKTIMQDVPVLGVGGGSGNAAQAATSITLRVTHRQAAELAFASDNGRLWLSLRPASGAPSMRPGIVTVETLLLGVKPVAIERTLRARR